MAKNKSNNEIVSAKVKLLDQINDLEVKLDSYLQLYALFLIAFFIFILIFSYCVVGTASLDIDDVATVSTCFLVIVGGWCALKTWQVSFIFNLRQERRTNTMQQIINHQNSNVYNTSKSVLHRHFPEYINSVDIKILPSISELLGAEDEATAKELGVSPMSGQQVEEVEAAFINLMNAYEQLASAIIHGYIDEDYIRANLRGQVVRICGLFSRSIAESNAESKKTFEYIIAIYDLWYISDIDKVKCHLGESKYLTESQ